MASNKKKILIVEDEADLRSLFAEQLENIGCEVHQAQDGEEGLALAKKIKPDLIISDVIMPKKDGNEFLKELRETDFGKDIPFIILTARAKMKDYFEVMNVDGFLEKPVKRKELIDRVKKVLALKTSINGVRVKQKKESKTKNGDDIVISPEISEGMELLLDKDMIAQEDYGVHFRAEPESKPKKKRLRADKKILILEDNLELCIELQKEISRRGYAALVVHTAGECLKEAASLSPDLIISRNKLPGVEIEELIKDLRKNSRLRTVPFIVYGNIGQKVYKDKVSKTGPAVFKLNKEGMEVLDKMDELLVK